jgi:hypothetical protein
MSYRRWRLCTSDLLVLTSLNQLIFILKILFTSKKQPYQATLMSTSASMNLSPQPVFLAWAHHCIEYLIIDKSCSVYDLLWGKTNVAVSWKNRQNVFFVFYFKILKIRILKILKPFFSKPRSHKVKQNLKYKQSLLDLLIMLDSCQAVQCLLV